MSRSSATKPPPVPFHALRAGMLASVVVALASGAHLAGGGSLPAFPVLLAIVALTVLAATVTTRFKLNAPAILATLGAAQLILHEGLVALSSTSAAGVSPRHGSHAGHGFHGPGELPAALSSAAGHGATGTGVAGQEHVLAGGFGMVLAHTAATVLCALLLSRGEAALWALSAWLRPLLGLPQAVTFAAGHSPAATSSPPSVPHRPWRNLRQDSRRGPPRAATVVVL